MPRARPVADASDALAPGAEVLRQAALSHLARFSCSEAGLARVLDRRIARWAKRILDLGGEPDRVVAGQEAARAAVPEVVAELVRIGAVSDTGFARTRASALARGGRSGRAIAAHLVSHGVEAGIVTQALDEVACEALEGSSQRELTAALMQARRRRLGPFAAEAEFGEAGSDISARRRALGALARAGFAHDVAVQALDYDRDAAEILIARLRGS